MTLASRVPRPPTAAPHPPHRTGPDAHEIARLIVGRVRDQDHRGEVDPTRIDRPARIGLTPAHARRAPRWRRRTPSARLTPARTWYSGLSRGQQTRVDLAFGLLAPFVGGYLVYLPIAWFAPVLAEVWFWTIVVALVGTSLIIGVECARATRFPEPPAPDELADEDLPRLAVVVAAYLPNEAETLMESLAAHLAVDYPRERHLVVLAYNTPVDLPVEADLADLARRDPRFLALRVEGSTSKVHNVNAALDHLQGLVDVIGFFDADHHPAPTAPRRVARWLADAAGPGRYDVVQGQCMVRNADDTWVTRTVAAEFGTMYAVSHPGRTVFNDFGIFGGSNGWWRAEMISVIGMDEDMLTEDIDSSCRALAAGARLGTDPRIVSTELAPSTLADLWRQRIRWSQGWWQVSLRHLRPLTLGRGISGAQRRGVALLLGWRAAHPWVATQMIPLVLAQLTLPNRPTMHLDLLLFVFTTVVVMGIPFLQALVANRVTPPGLRRRPWLFVRYAVLSSLGYSELKATATRAAVLRELLGARSWDVTARRRLERKRPWVRRTQVPVGAASRIAS